MLTGPRKLLATGIIGVALLGGLLYYVGLDKVVQAFTQSDPRLILGAFLAYALFFLTRGVRWTLLLKPVKTSVAETSGLTAAGWLINNVAPMKAGDVGRAVMVARRKRVSFVTVFSTVAVERILDLLGLGIAATVALMLIPTAGLPGWFTLLLDLAWILPLIALAGLWAAVTWKARVLTQGGALLERMRVPEKPRGKLLGFAAASITGAEGLLREPRTLLTALPLTLLMTLCQVATFTCLFLAFVPGADPVRVAAGVPFFILSFAISVTPGNVGTYEGAFAAIYIALGFSAEQVVPVAILTHVFTFLIVAILGSAAIMMLGLDIARVKEEAKAFTTHAHGAPPEAPGAAAPPAPAATAAAPKEAAP